MQRRYVSTDGAIDSALLLTWLPTSCFHCCHHAERHQNDRKVYCSGVTLCEKTDMYKASGDEFPLMLKLCPAETLPIVVTEALNELTLFERFKNGS
jgi:hypothetical protein